MKSVGYYNGKIDELEKLTVPALDRGLYFGDGVYDVALIHNGQPVSFDDHIDRFFNSCKLLKININKTKEELKDIFMNLLNYADGEKDYLLYWQMTRGVAPRNHVFPENTEPSLFAYITPKKFGDQKKRIKLITQEDVRFYLCNIKTVNLIPNVLASEEAKQRGCQECVLHRGDIVTEGAHTSILIIKDGKLVAPPLSNLILPGTTRKRLFRVCDKYNIPYEIRNFTLDELFSADEILSMSTTSIILAAEEIDGKKCGGKNPEMVDKIQRLYFDMYGLDL